MYSVALTGNVAAGKSAVAERWAALGVPVVSADDLARRAVLPGTPGLERVVEAFGREVLAADGSLDRSQLGDLVFADDEARSRLEEIVHPAIWALRDEWLTEQRRAGAGLVISEIPLLYETGRERDFDAVVFVDAPASERLRRMITDRGLTEEAARRVIGSQLDPAVKRERADHVLMNDGSLAALHAASDELLERLRREAGEQPMRIDMHLHTAGSWDCLSDPERVLDAALSLGYSRIAITDHNRVHVALRMAEAYPDRIIPGEEVKTGEGIDVIGLYLAEEIPKGTPAEETVVRIREQGGIAYLPHPYAAGKGGGGAFAERIGSICDVIEVFNARLHSSRMNVRARDLAVRHGKLMGAGSDAHTVGEIGNARVDLPAHANTAMSLRVALERGVAHGREASRLVHLASTWAKVRRTLPAAPPQ